MMSLFSNGESKRVGLITDIMLPAVKECLVNVEYLGLVRNVLQQSHEQYSLPPDATIKTLLRELAQRHGREVVNCIVKSDGTLRPMTEIYLNGRDIKTLTDLDTALSQESQVLVVVSLNAIPGG